MEMVGVPAGVVRPHDRRTARTWDTKVAAFCLGRTPVAREQLADLTGRRPGGDAGLPVVDVSWWDALSCCNALSGRDGLPRVYGPDSDVGTRDLQRRHGELTLDQPLISHDTFATAAAGRPGGGNLVTAGDLASLMGAVVSGRRRAGPPSAP